MGSVENVERDRQSADDLVGPTDPPPAEPGGRDGDRGGGARAVVRGIGEVLITAGLVILLFVVYEVYVTDWISAGKQRDATVALDRQWTAPQTPTEAQRMDHFQGLKEGDGFAKMYVPAFGPDYHFTVLEGTTESSLEVGPGHYKNTAYPGQNGNFAVAGHRVGKGAPFNDIDLLNSCDAIVVETREDWFVYRVLPKDDEVKGWAAGKGKQAKCKNVAPLGGPYSGLAGQEIVLPTQGTVVAPVPHQDSIPNSGAQVGLMTLTTCNPKFSDRQRLIVHAVLVHQVPKGQLKPGQLPDELKES